MPDEVANCTLAARKDRDSRSNPGGPGKHLSDGPRGGQAPAPTLDSAVSRLCFLRPNSHTMLAPSSRNLHLCTPVCAHSRECLVPVCTSEGSKTQGGSFPALTISLCRLCTYLKTRRYSTQCVNVYSLPGAQQIKAASRKVKLQATSSQAIHLSLN